MHFSKICRSAICGFYFFDKMSFDNLVFDKKSSTSSTTQVVGNNFKRVEVEITKSTNTLQQMYINISIT
jgi:hypothetical protein